MAHTNKQPTEVLMAYIQTTTKAPLQSLRLRLDKRKEAIKMLLILLLSVIMKATLEAKPKF